MHGFTICALRQVDLARVVLVESGWDEEVSADLQGRWRLWLQDLLVLAYFTMNRCISPDGLGELRSAALHHFADASQAGCVCVSYLCLLNYSDVAHCTFAKARVAPPKQLSIPRLELTAAIVAAKVDTQLPAELIIPLDDSQYCTDSNSVLGYIKNERIRVKKFVANRVALCSLTAEPHWYHIPRSWGHLTGWEQWLEEWSRVSLAKGAVLASSS